MSDFNENIYSSKQELGEVARKGMNWLKANFHKLSETNKLKVLIAIVNKLMPDKIEHSGEVKSGTRITIINDERTVQVNSEADRSKITSDQ